MDASSNREKSATIPPGASDVRGNTTGAASHATRNREAKKYVQLPAWFVLDSAGRYRLATEDEAREARAQQYGGDQSA